MPTTPSMRVPAGEVAGRIASCARAGAGWLAGAVTDTAVLLDLRVGEQVAKHGAVTCRLDAVQIVLRAAGTALHYGDISQVASRRGLISSCESARAVEDSLGRFLHAHTRDDNSPIVSLGQGVFGLKVIRPVQRHRSVLHCK